MEQLFQVLMSLYLAWLILGTTAYIMLMLDEEKNAGRYYGFVTSYVYKNSKMNIIGCIVFALGYYILFPIVFILRGIYMTIFWLFHVGRKN